MVCKHSTVLHSYFPPNTLNFCVSLAYLFHKIRVTVNISPSIFLKTRACHKANSTRQLTSPTLRSHLKHSHARIYNHIPVTLRMIHSVPRNCLIFQAASLPLPLGKMILFKAARFFMSFYLSCILVRSSQCFIKNKYIKIKSYFFGIISSCPDV